MNIYSLGSIPPDILNRILERSAGMNPSILPEIETVMESVKTDGDRALVELMNQRFGNGRLPALKVSKGDILQAYEYVPKELITAFRQMKDSITAVHSAQLPRKTDRVVRTARGIEIWRVWRPIGRVGLYIPGGKAVYPSSVLMTAIPAKIAGCGQIIMCSPAARDGRIPAETAVAADIAGITDLFAIGGAEAIAAMAYGTQTVPKVDKIFGAGGAAVTAAKMLALQTVAIDMPAGPSEVLVIADETANPAFIAADLMADGEHGEDSACVLVTTSRSIAERTRTEIETQLESLPTADRIRKSLAAYGLIAVADTLDGAIRFVNTYAPEHLEIMTRNPLKLVDSITDAGSVFVGPWTAKAAGDYATGANHVLPTGGMAKSYPPLGVDAFGKWMQVQRCTNAGLSCIRNTIEILSVAERLPAHGKSASIRFT